MAFTEIPIIDVSQEFSGRAKSGKFADEFTTICHEIGFAIVVNHGVSPQLFAETFDMMDRFFALPEEEKRRIDKNRSPQFRGWEPVGAESTNNAPDQREQIDVWTEWPTVDGGPPYNKLLGPNQWLPDEVLAGHRDISMRWIESLSGVARRLMSALAVGLGFDAKFFEDLFGPQPMSLAKFIHYPPTSPGGAGVNPHHDAGFLTVLAPGTTPGLQVQNTDGGWVDVPAVEHGFVINLGEGLQSMTGNYLVATPHRVITDAERFSAGYFHGPSLSTELKPLPLAREFGAAVAASDHHRAAGFMPTPDEAVSGTSAMASAHRPEAYGDQLWNYFSRSYPDQMLKHHDL